MRVRETDDTHIDQRQPLKGLSIENLVEAVSEGLASDKRMGDT